MQKYDLDFGVKTWYLKPSFIARVINAILSIIITIYLFNCCVLLSDHIYKEAISKFPLALCSILAISIIISTVSFIVMIFRLAAEFQFYISITSVCSALLFIALELAFIFACTTSSALNSAEFSMLKYLKENENKSEVADFLTKLNSNLTIGKAIDKPLKVYLMERTTDIGSALFAMSFIWTLVSLYIYYYFLYTGSASKLIENEPTTNDQSMEENLTNSPQIVI